MATVPIGPRILRLIQETNHSSSNHALNAINFRFADKLDVEADAGDPYAREVVAKIDQLLPCGIQDHPRIGAIRTALAEAKIYYRLRSVLGIRRVPEAPGKKTPDFEIVFSNGLATERIPTEIKAPDVVGGDAASDVHMAHGLDAKIDVERQVNAGHSIAWGAQTVTAWGPNATMPTVTKALVAKLRQNIKRDQLRDGAILVVDLPTWFMRLSASAAQEMRTSYTPRGATPDVQASGILWHAAFGRLGAVLRGFDGEEEGPLELEGVMHTYPEVRALTFYISGEFVTFVRPLVRPSATNSDALVYELVQEFSTYANDEADKFHAGFRRNDW